MSCNVNVQHRLINKPSGCLHRPILPSRIFPCNKREPAVQKMVIAKAKKSHRLYRLVLLQSSIPRSEVSRNKDFLTVILRSLIYCWEPIWKGWIGNWMWAIIRMFPWTERVSSHVLFSCHNAVHFKSHFRVLRGYIKKEWRKKRHQGHCADSGNPKGTFQTH